MSDYNKRKDSDIGYKYLNKNNLLLGTNYYTFIVFLGGASAAFFFINSTIPLAIIGGVVIFFYYIMYLGRKKKIITSVTVYNFSEIFLEVLKSYKINKKNMSKFKSFLFKNKNNK